MKENNLKLGVNIDHVATLRQARGTAYPDPLEAALCCARAGAQGITVHLREDRRHIQDTDVVALRQSGPLALNLEMANHPEIVGIALDIRPEEVCLVPERRQELTTEGGLDVAGQQRDLEPAIRALQEAGITVSLFIDPQPEQVKAAAAVGASHVELHTGRYCELPPESRAHELERLVEGARLAHSMGLIVNAGHGINLDNVGGILEIPFMDTLNIGHSIVSRAVFVGLEAAVREMMEQLSLYRGGRVQT